MYTRLIPRPVGDERAALRYGLAVVLPLAALAASFAARPFLGSVVFIFFFGSSIITSGLAGGGPGFVATFFGVFLAQYFLLSPNQMSFWDPANLGRTALFVVFSSAAAILSEARNRALRASVESEGRFLAMAENAPVFIWMSDADGRRTYVNQAWLSFRGRTLAQEIGAGWNEGLHPENRQSSLSAIEDHLRRREPFRLEYRLRRADGEYRWLLDSGVPRFLPGGTFAGYVGSSIDVTDFKEAQVELLKSQEELEARVRERTAELATANRALRAEIEERSRVEDALRESEERYRLLVNDVQDYAIFVVDAKGLVRSWNLGAERIHGYEPDEILGQSLSLFFEGDAVGKADALLKTARAEARAEDEGWRQRKDGQRFWGNTVLTALHNQEGDIESFSVITRDMTERRQAEEALKQKEEELFQSRKLEAVGRLAGGVAHDFNNLITGIVGISQDVLSDIPIGDHRAADMEEIIKAANRAGSLTRQLLAFGRRQIASPVVVNLNTILQDMDKMLRRLIGEDVQLATILDAQLGYVKADPGQIEQIVINLVLNSRDAMPQGGKITLETTNVDLTEEYSKRHFEVKPGPYVCFAVSDTGSGMDEETQAHIFEPFFSTKSKDKGTGLGLATVYGIVKQNGGDIFFYSNPGAGTTFKIYLPRVTETGIGERRKSSRGSLEPGSETVLLVEDESIVRRVAAKTLHKQGYTVLEAANGKEALEICATYVKPIHLLLTDVIMPGLNGRQLAEMIVGTRPDIRVLYMSGYTENIIVQRGILKPGIAFIEKSFTAEVLCRKVREVLDGPVRNS